MYPKYLPASTFSDLSDYWSRGSAPDLDPGTTLDLMRRQLWAPWGDCGPAHAPAPHEGPLPLPPRPGPASSALSPLDMLHIRELGPTKKHCEIILKS